MASRDTPYRRLEEVKVKALGEGSVSCYLLHQGSNMCVSDVSEALDQKGVLYTDFPSQFAQNYSLFASKDRTKVEVMARANDKYFSDVSKWRDLMLEAYAELKMPECCLNQVRYDAEDGLSPVARLGMQLIDLVGQYHVSGSKLHDKVRAADDVNRNLKSIVESKDRWTEEETRPVEEEKGGRSNNDDVWAMLAELNDGRFREGEPLLRRAFLNVRLARELPMCRPDCEKAFDSYTSRLASASESLGYGIGALADGAVDFLEDAVGSYWNGRKAKNMSELEAVVKSGVLTEMKSVSDLQLDRIREYIMAARGYEARVLGLV